MFEPWQLIGMGYRLGADPFIHGRTDCLGLSRAVLAHYGIESPAASRSWYRRCKAGDWAIFPEQLNLWGELTIQPRIGAIALIRSEDRYGLGAWYLDGWLTYAPSKLIQWQPPSALEVAGIYCHTK